MAYRCVSHGQYFTIVYLRCVLSSTSHRFNAAGPTATSRPRRWGRHFLRHTHCQHTPDIADYACRWASRYAGHCRLADVAANMLLPTGMLRMPRRALPRHACFSPAARKATPPFAITPAVTKAIRSSHAYAGVYARIRYERRFVTPRRFSLDVTGMVNRE